MPPAPSCSRIRKWEIVCPGWSDTCVLSDGTECTNSISPSSHRPTISLPDRADFVTNGLTGLVTVPDTAVPMSRHRFAFWGFKSPREWVGSALGTLERQVMELAWSHAEL